LETFYHVAHHGGISRAAGQPPYRIQQPAISEQIRSLEVDIGRKLFRRQPFRLTQEGRVLYGIFRQFFEALQAALPELRRGLQSQVRIGADDLLIRHYLPKIVRPLATPKGGFRFSFHSGPAMEMAEQLQAGEVDLVVAPFADRMPAGLAGRLILELPLVLIVAKESEIQSADQFWTSGATAPPLVCPGQKDGIGQAFRRGLKRGGIQWTSQIEASSVTAVAAFVAGGHSVGVSLDVPCLTNRPDVRVLPLRGFDPVPITVLWRPPDMSRLKPLIGLIERFANTLR
jgi:DNA-binding transcriptional LysR family regulator